MGLWPDQPPLPQLPAQVLHALHPVAPLAFKALCTIILFLISFLMRVLPLFLSNLVAASCASYNFSFLSPQGLNFSSQSSSSPFWSGTGASPLWRDLPPSPGCSSPSLKAIASGTCGSLLSLHHPQAVQGSPVLPWGTAWK